MPVIQVKFRRYLSEQTTPWDPRGPRFHGWLPNGTEDAIELLSLPDGTRLIAWFERFGEMRDGFIEFADNKREVDEATLAKQGHVDAGPLFAQLWCPVSDEELHALSHRMERHPRTGPPPPTEPAEVDNLSKRIWRLCFEPLSSFVDTLIVTFGQFWLAPLPAFDSRERSAVEYVEQALGAHHWSADGVNWTRYPGGRLTAITFRVQPEAHFRQYLTRDDWNLLAGRTSKHFRPSVAASVLARAVQLFGLGHTSEAFVQGVAGLEAAAAECVKEGRSKGVFVEKLFPGFTNLNGRQQAAICAMMTNVAPDQIQQAQEAIDLRNQIVHEGLILTNAPTPKQRELLRAAIAVGSAICPSGPVRFVELDSGNQMTAPDSAVR